jgi:hypothetical protein
MLTGIIAVAVGAVLGLVVLARRRPSLVPAALAQRLAQEGFQRQATSRGERKERWKREDPEGDYALTFEAETRTRGLRYTLSCEEEPSTLEWLRPFFNTELVACEKAEAPVPSATYQVVSESLGHGLELSVTGKGTSLSPAELEKLLALGRPFAPELNKLPKVYFDLLIVQADKSDATAWWIFVEWDPHATTDAELNAALSLVHSTVAAVRSTS